MNKNFIIGGLIVILLVSGLTILLLFKPCGLHFDFVFARNRVDCKNILQNNPLNEQQGNQDEESVMNMTEKVGNNFKDNLKPNNIKVNNDMQDNLNFTTEYINITPIKLKIGEETTITKIPGLKIKLVELISEGRCPTDVNCVRAGWAKVLVQVSYKGVNERSELSISGGTPYVFSEPKELTDRQDGETGNIILIGEYKIFLVLLNPYPDTKSKIDKNEYEAVFLIDTKTNLDFKREIAKVAHSELKKHLTDADQYVAIDIAPKTDGAAEEYTITFKVPFSADANRRTVKVRLVNGIWLAEYVN